MLLRIPETGAAPEILHLFHGLPDECAVANEVVKHHHRRADTRHDEALDSDSDGRPIKLLGRHEHGNRGQNCKHEEDRVNYVENIEEVADCRTRNLTHPLGLHLSTL